MTKRIQAIAATFATLIASGAIPVAAAGPGSHTAAEVNASIEKAVAYLDAHQQVNGSWDTGAGIPVAETSFALITYGVSDRSDVNNLSPARQAIVKKAIVWLLGQQDTTTGNQTSGSWHDGARYTYMTGLAVSALSFSNNGDPGIPAAIAAGRAALIALFQGPSHNPPETCSTAHSDPTAVWCGGYNYDYGSGSHSDESNTGFALTGLRLSGGLPPALAALNTGWQRNIQVISTNQFVTDGRNDGGGAYEPQCATRNGFCPGFTSNANDTGSMLFGYAYDGIPAADPGVTAGLKIGQDVLDVYELTTGTRNMVYHTGVSEDGSCAPGGGCDWAFGGGEGGYHYSLWSLSKGLGEYIPPDLVSPTNWYAKVVDLLLTQQNVDGTWPVDGRDDGTAIVSLAFSVLAVGLAATPPPGVGNFTAAGDCGVTHLSWTNPATANYGGVEIRRRTDVFPTSPTDGAEVTNAPAPTQEFDDMQVINGAKYLYGAFSYDNTKQLFGPEVTASLTTPSCPGLPNAGARSRPQPQGPAWFALLFGMVILTLGVGSAMRQNVE
jgi:hypothetical protein